jgi:3-oxoacyl-[acyl-carrier protein] reductase
LNSPRPACRCWHYGNGAKEAKAVVVEIREMGARADAVQADLAAPDGAHRLAKQVRDIVGGRLDILVANAGISKSAAKAPSIPW